MEEKIHGRHTALSVLHGVEGGALYSLDFFAPAGMSSVPRWLACVVRIFAFVQRATCLRSVHARKILTRIRMSSPGECLLACVSETLLSNSSTAHLVLCGSSALRSCIRYPWELLLSRPAQRSAKKSSA